MNLYKQTLLNHNQKKILYCARTFIYSGIIPRRGCSCLFTHLSNGDVPNYNNNNSTLYVSPYPFPNLLLPPSTSAHPQWPNCWMCPWRSPRRWTWWSRWETWSRALTALRRLEKEEERRPKTTRRLCRNSINCGTLRSGSSSKSTRVPWRSSMGEYSSDPEGSLPSVDD